MDVISETTEWYPGEIFSDNPAFRKFGLIVLNQPFELRSTFYRRIWSNASWVIAADGGANRVHGMNYSGRVSKTSLDFLHVDTIIGDLDSLDPKVRQYWLEEEVELIRDPDQYSTDFTKAVNYMRSFRVPDVAEYTPSQDLDRKADRLAVFARKPEVIVALGGLGGRVDQGMSVLHHLYVFQKDYSLGRIFLLSSEGITFVLKAGKHRIKAKENIHGMGLGKHVGIIPLKEPSVITTKGLEWDVKDWPTEFGGQISTSNHTKEEWVMIETTKDVLFTIDLDLTTEAPK
jgi:thiamine pyrophosphokinase